MSSEKLDPESRYGNYTLLGFETNAEDLFKAYSALKDNLKESLPKEMADKAQFRLYWIYEP
jgi:hypothetical protein